MIGEIINHFKILEKLGSGGMGVVYKAEDIKLHRTVALKFLPYEFTGDDEARNRFIHEAQLASSLQHNNICTIHEIDETDDGDFFIAMDYYEGETLKSRLAKGAMNQDEIFDIVLQISSGLSVAHENGIIHRDIKPANIFITKNGTVKILDFGLAKSSNQTQLTRYNKTFGTINYMSPEQTLGGKIDKRTDIWSLGVVMYEMITGQTPFKGTYNEAIIYSLLNENADLEKIPKELVQIIEKMLTKSVIDRYQNVDELTTDLQGLQPKSTTFRTSLLKLTKTNSNLKIKIILSTFFTVLVTLIIIYYLNSSNDSNTLANDTYLKMIVVLPFENLGSPEDNNFTMGMREEISNKLAALGTLGVISRNSAEKYENSNKSIREIGKELGVDYILEGTVQWSKKDDKINRVKIIPQLVRVSDDKIILSESFDRVIDDVFNLQNEIAQNVVNKLGIKLLPGQSVTGPPPTTNLNAYDYYLKARPFHYGPTTGDNLKTCIKLYEKAVELDTNFAAAYAQISIAYMGLFIFYLDRDSLNLEKSENYIDKAKKINPDIAEVHLRDFFKYVWFTNDSNKVIQELKRVLEIQPNNAEALWHIQGYYYGLGNIELADQCDEKAMKLDPLNARYPWGSGLFYKYKRDYKKAEKFLKRAVELNPNFSNGYVGIAENYLDWKGDTKLARQIVQNIKDEEYLEWSCNIFIYLNILDRKFEEALKQLKSSKKEYENSDARFISNSEMIGFVYKYMGNEELSKDYFNSTKNNIEKILLDDPDDTRLHFALCRCYAALNDTDRAIAEMNKGIRIDNIIGKNEKTVRARNLTYVYILNGKYKDALPQIDYLLSTPTELSVNKLKLDPLYDPLRNLQGYKTTIEKYSL